MEYDPLHSGWSGHIVVLLTRTIVPLVNHTMRIVIVGQCFRAGSVTCVSIAAEYVMFINSVAEAVYICKGHIYLLLLRLSKLPGPFEYCSIHNVLVVSVNIH